MKRFAVALMAVLAISSVGSAQEAPAQQKHTVTFNGEGTVAATPDQVQITCSIWGQDADGKLAREMQSIRSKNILDFLKKTNIDEKDYRTTWYRYEPVYEYNQEKHKDVLVGYRAQQGLHVCAPIAQASTLVDGLAEQGFISGVQFTVSNLAAKREEALKLAIDNAKTNAKKRADNLGIKLGKMVGYSEWGGGPRPVQYERMDAAPGARAMSASLPSGGTEIQATVSVTYEIE